MERVNLHRNHLSTPCFHLRCHAGGGVAHIQAHLNYQSGFVLHLDHLIEHGTLFIASQLEPELLLSCEGLDRSVDRWEVVLGTVAQDVVHRANLFVVLDLVQPEAKTLRVGDPLVLIFLPPAPLNHSDWVFRWWCARSLPQVLSHGCVELLVVDNLQALPGATHIADLQGLDDKAVPCATLQAPSVRSLRHLLQDIQLMLMVIVLAAHEEEIAVGFATGLETIRRKALKQPPYALGQSQPVEGNHGHRQLRAAALRERSRLREPAIIREGAHELTLQGSEQGRRPDVYSPEGPNGVGDVLRSAAHVVETPVNNLICCGFEKRPVTEMQLGIRPQHVGQVLRVEILGQPALHLHGHAREHVHMRDAQGRIGPYQVRAILWREALQMLDRFERNPIHKFRVPQAYSSCRHFTVPTRTCECP
mmetsp:Transcript_77873/g.252435  ORF Transcript_77873/g.252435 Transcript_77873/m.252435 type:complete len:419 (+) Transcript_77873:645-1901(+)